MKIQYASDLHLEFSLNTYYLHEKSFVKKADILVLAGDIYPFCKSADKLKFFDIISQKFDSIYWVPGNHEYYGSDIIRFYKYKLNQIRPNIQIVNDSVITIENVNLIFSTLWSFISPQKELIIQSNLSDFSVIKIDGEDFRPNHYNSLHLKSKDFIEKELAKRPGQKNVVITHHAPTFYKYPEQYKNSPLNEAFASELYELIEKYQPEAWIYGHTHSNEPEFNIGKTKLLTNQLGYVQMGEHKTFRTDAYFEI